MKILALENEPTGNRGGMQWSFLDVCRGLAELGHEVHLIYNKDGNLLDNYRSFCKSVTKVYTYKIDSSSPSKKITSAIAWLSSLVRSLKLSPDVIYVNQYHDTFFAGTLAKIKQVPLVSHLRVFPPHRFYRRYCLGIKAVTKFIAVSESTRQAYLEAGFAPEIVEVVYNGINIQRFNMKKDRLPIRQELGLPPEAFVAIYAGRLDRAKNIEMLIRAFDQLGLPPEKAQLLIAGGPFFHDSPEAGEQYVQELKALCTELGLQDCVQWLGRRSDIPELFRVADVNVLPSTEDTFGRTLVESMACGTPSVGLRVGGIPEVLSGEFQRFLVDRDDIDGLATILKSLQTWRQEDPALGQRCRTYVENHFSINRTVAGVEKVLKQAVSLGAARLGPAPEILHTWHRDQPSSASPVSIQT